MEDSNNSSKRSIGMGVGIAMLVAGLVVGYLIGMVMNKDSADTDNAANTSESMTKDTAMTAESDGVTVGGAKMVRTKDIVDNAVNAKNVTTVVAAVQAAGLVDTLKSPGPFTVFAPDNAAFEKLPAGTVDTLLKPENKATLTSILTYHVVSGTYTAGDLSVMASKGETLKTVQGETLTVVKEDNAVKLKDAKGNVINIVTADIISSNGVTHVVDSVMMPAS